MNGQSYVTRLCISRTVRARQSRFWHLTQSPRICSGTSQKKVLHWQARDTLNAFIALPYTALHYTTLHYTTLLVSRQYSAVQLITWHQYNSIIDSTIHAELLPLLLLLLLCQGPQAHSTLIVRHAELFTPYFIVNFALTIQSFLRSEGVG